MPSRRTGSVVLGAAVVLAAAFGVVAAVFGLDQIWLYAVVFVLTAVAVPVLLRSR